MVFIVILGLLTQHC